jgi:predicted nuclease of predicted toxin-antitoxin system
VKVFLDENFPLTLVHRLREDGHDAEHVITVGWRGASDERIAERLVEADLLFLTQDEDFLFTRDRAAVIVLSRVKQARPLAERIAIWREAVRRLSEQQEARRFELLDDGTLIPWEEGPQNSWVARAPHRPA